MHTFKLQYKLHTFKLKIFFSEIAYCYLSVLTASMFGGNILTASITNIY